MSDTPQGPGWWQASDGKWYPPQQAPGVGYGTPASDTTGKSTAALVCSILSFVVCPVILAVVGLVLASQAKQEVLAQGGDPSRDSTAKAARIIAWVHLALFAVLAVFGVLLVIVAVLGENAEVKLNNVGEPLQIARFLLRF
jgi:nitric oxide reductase large subunit